MSFPVSAIPDDFPDRVSPMIVKEVRQGLRSKSFIGSFLILHGVLVLWAVGFLSETSAPGGSGADGLFWTILIMGLLFIAMRAQSAVRGERDGGTLELLRLTRIPAWSIVSGKWCALMIEALVLVAGVLPYFMLRYYFGTLQVTRDLLIVLILLVGCGLLAALMTMVSCLGKMLAGLARAGTFIFGIMTLWTMAVMAFGGGRALGAFDDPGLAGLYLALAAPYCMIFLGVAASAVASASENIATRQRLLGFALLIPAAVAALCSRSVSEVGGLVGAAVPGLCLVAFECVLRRSNTSMPLYAEQVARSRWRRPLFAVFAPSHGAGIACVLLIWLTFAGVLLAFDRRGDSLRFGVACVAVLNAVLLPAALGMVVRRFMVAPFAARYWIGFATLTLPVAMLGSLTAGVLADAARTLIALFPAGVLALLGRDEVGSGYLAATTAVHLVLAASVLGPFVLHDLRAVRRMMRGERAPLPVA